MSAWNSAAAPRGPSSPLGLVMTALGGDEASCRRLFAREIERFAAGAAVSALGAGARSAIVLSGWACEMRILIDGRRQIFNFLAPGDVLEVAPRAKQGSRSIIALTRLEIIDASAILREEAKAGRQGLVAEMVRAGARREERLFDHIVRLGRQSAYERVIHLILELCERLTAVGLVKNDSFRVPLTQEHFADALGLSLVHVNRTLQQLRREGLIELKSGTITLLKPQRLAMLAGYQVETDPAPRVGARGSYAQEWL